MDVERDNTISASPSKIFNDGHLAIEVPETAHQISTGTLLFTFSYVRYVASSITLVSEELIR